MSGLSLSMGGYGAAAVPTAANQPTGTTINQAAFGIGTTQPGAEGAGTAGFGTLSLGIAGAIVLAWLWYTLPR